MDLQEWIDNKIEELKTEQKYKVAIFKQAKEIKLARYSTSYDLFCAKDVALDTEVKDVDKNSLPDTMNTDEYVSGVQVILEVLKPRKRKTEREYLTVQIA